LTLTTLKPIPILVAALALAGSAMLSAQTITQTLTFGTAAHPTATNVTEAQTTQTFNFFQSSGAPADAVLDSVSITVDIHELATSLRIDETAAATALSFLELSNLTLNGTIPDLASLKATFPVASTCRTPATAGCITTYTVSSTVVAPATVLPLTAPPTVVEFVDPTSPQYNAGFAALGTATPFHYNPTISPAVANYKGPGLFTISYSATTHDSFQTGGGNYGAVVTSGTYATFTVVYNYHEPVKTVPDMTITKSHTGTFTQGQVGATFTVGTSNVGTGTTTGNVLVTEYPPAGLTLTAMSGPGWTCVSLPYCSRSDPLAPGAAYPPITVTVNVSPTALGTLTNTAIVSGGGEGNITNDTATDPVTIVTIPDMTITKSHTGSFSQGQTGGIFTLTASNVGTAATSGAVTVTDSLPAGLTATGMAGSGWSCTAGTLTCTRSDVLAVGATWPIITVTVSVSPTATGTLVNNANVSGGSEVNLTNDNASDPVTILGVPDMTITKSHAGNFTAGQVGATYKIVASNIGPVATSGLVTVTDTLPGGLTATGMSGTGWICNTGSLTCSRNDALGPNAAYPPIAVTVNVSPIAVGTLVNTAVVGGGGELNLTNDTATDPVTINGVPDMTITKSHSGNFTQGQTGGVFTINTVNVGTAATSGVVTVNDTLPAGLTATAMNGNGWGCTLATLSCTRNDSLAVGGSYPPITVTVSVAPAAIGTLTNVATVGGGGEVNFTNDTASDPVIILGIPDMTITKTHTGTFVAGQSGAFTIGTSNVGTAASSGTVTVNDTLPAGLTATAIAGTGWTCTFTPLACSRYDSVLAVGAAYPPITLTVSIAATATGTLVNTAVVGGGGEVNLTNDTATDPVSIATLPDLTITKSHTGTPVRGGALTYTITASDVGGSATSGTVTVTDTLPAGLVASAISGNGWTCTLATLTCTRSDVLAAGAAYPAISLTVTIAGNAPNTVINTAVVGGGGETNLTNDTATDPATLSGGAPNLGLSKTHAPPSFVQGGTGTYFLTISNNGTAPTTGAVFADDPLTTGLTATSISGVGWTCDVPTLECTRPDVLAPGGSYPPVVITVKIASNAPPTATNVATVRGGGSPPGIGVTPATDSAPIAQVTPTLTLIKTSDRRTAQFGDVIGYQLNITNLNTVPIQNTVAQDVLPHGFVYVVNSGRIVSGAGAAQPIDPGNKPGILVFNVGTLLPSQSVVINYRVRVSPTSRVGENVNTAQVTANAPGGGNAASAPTGAAVTVTPGFLTLQQFIIGRVFEDTNGNGIYDPGERPVSGARIYLSNGQSANTDSKGMYNIPFVAPGSVTVLLDPASLPKGYTISSGGRLDASDWSRLQRTPLQNGMMLRQNFGIKRCQGSCRLDEPVQAASAAAPSGPGSSNAAMKLAIAPGQDSLAADGRSSMAVEVRLLDAQGVPVPAKEIRIRTSAGQFLSDANTQTAGRATNNINPNPNQPQSLFGTKTAAQMGQTIEQVPQRLQADAAPSPMGVATFTLLAPNTPGTAQLIAEAGDPEHLITASAEVSFMPEKRSPILSGVGEITVGRAAADYDIYQQSGIVSRHADAFLRTALGEGNLFTMAYTSHLAINDSAGNAGLFQLDPLDRVYQVFGDSSTQYAAAQSRTHVYARLERGLSYVLFGDLRMGAGQTNGQNTPAPQSFASPGAVTGSIPGQASAFGLGEYNRNLLGAAIHLENKEHDSITVEGARPNTAFARDVFPGSTFGLIQLSHPAIMPGSETASLEVRDRHNPAILLSTETLVSSVDYSLDPATGAIFFLRSLNAFDQALNLIQVVFTYEYQTFGLTSSVYAVRAEKRISAWGTRAGLGVVDQRDPGTGSYFLGDFNLQQNLPKSGHLVIEVPVTHGAAVSTGAQVGSLGSIPANVNGVALRLELDQPIGVAEGRIRASVIRTDAGFFNPYGATTLPGSQTSRGSFEFAPLKKSKVKFAFTDERNKTSLVDNQRQTASIEWKQALDNHFAVTGGYDFRDFQNSLVSQQAKSNMLSAGLDWRMTSKLMASVRREQNVSGNADPTYPNETLLSARYQATETVRLFFTQRFASAPITPIGDLSGTGYSALSGKNETAIGIEDRWSRYTTVQSSYLIQNGINGTDSYALVGLMNRLPVTTHFNIELGLQRGELISGKDGSFNAGSVGFSWLPQKNFKWSTRYELRDRGGLGQIFTTGVAGKVADGLTALGRFQYSNAAFQSGSGAVDVLSPQSVNPALSTLNTAYLGTAALAWRPWKREKEGVLFSYTLRSSDLNGSQTVLPQTDRVSLLSTDAFYEFNRHVEFYNKFAWSGRSYNYVGYDPVSTNTFLWQGRVQAKISHRFDAAYEVRVIDQPTASLNEWTMAVEGGVWLVRDLRAGVGYSFKSADYIAANFLTNPVRQGAYFVLSSKLSNMFNLFAPVDCGCPPVAPPPPPPPAPKPVANVQISAITGAHDVCPGENVRLSVTASGWLPEQTPNYEWYINNRLVQGATGPAMMAPTTGSGVFSIRVSVSAGESSKIAVPVNFTVLPTPPPTVRLSVLPLTIPYGDHAQLTASSPGSACTDPVTIRYTASEGSLQGTQFDSTPMVFDMQNRSRPQSKLVHFTATATDKIGQIGTASADITVTLTPVARRLDDVVFTSNSSRVNNCGKRLLLEELTPMLRSDPDAKVILIGHRDNGERLQTVDMERVLNAAAVLSAGSGICPQLDLSRVLINAVGADQSSATRPALCGSSTEERAGSAVSASDARAQFRRVEIWFVPGGAALPEGMTGLKQAPDRDVQAKGCPR
jgi:uncharacterized repeat protein (TIGR01451 family)